MLTTFSVEPIEEDPTTDADDTTLPEPADAGDLVALDGCVDEALFHSEHARNLIHVEDLAIRVPRLQ